MARPAKFEVISDRVVGREGGFFALRRLRLRNVRPDGTRSREYACDFLLRPAGIDAVAVVVYARRPDGGVDVLLRDALRPALRFGREPAELPVPDAEEGVRSGLLTEVVAGIIEPEDRGERGVRARAALEVEEEAGIAVEPGAVRPLGPPVFLSPGAMPEKLHFACVEVDPAAARRAEGDGSPMEEAAECRWLPLEQALAECAAGRIEDIKTELGLRRLRDALR